MSFYKFSDIYYKNLVIFNTNMNKKCEQKKNEQICSQ